MELEVEKKEQGRQDEYFIYVRLRYQCIDAWAVIGCGPGQVGERGGKPLPFYFIFLFLSTALYTFWQGSSTVHTLNQFPTGIANRVQAVQDATMGVIQLNGPCVERRAGGGEGA